jgi:hypothetical protein
MAASWQFEGYVSVTHRHRIPFSNQGRSTLLAMAWASIPKLETNWCKTKKWLHEDAFIVLYS